jgi:hypothetical protein
MSYVIGEYAKMKRNEIRLLKAGALQEVTRCQRAAFLLSIKDDYAIRIKEEDDLFGGTTEDNAICNE